MRIPENLLQIERRVGDIIQKIESLSDGNNAQIESQGIKPAENTGEKFQEELLSAIQSDQKGSAQEKSQYDSLIHSLSSKHGISPDLIQAVMQTESGGNPQAVSPAGAIGLMQLMPGTAKELGVDPRNPAENLEGGVRYLKQLSKKFDSLDDVLAAYNAGPGAVKRFGGVPPYQETEKYIEKVRSTIDRKM